MTYASLRRLAKLRRQRRARAGFSLVELMVVIVILGLLATVVVLNVLPARDRAMVEKAGVDVAMLESAIDTYRLDNLTYPPTLEALVEAPAGLERPDRYRAGGYVRDLPDDPWGNAYQYQQPGQHGAVDIWSFGGDGQAGGEGHDADIGNWQ